MSKGFRKSLFGFNTDDVISYITASDKSAKAKTEELKRQIADLKKENEELKVKNSELSIKADEYESKKEQIRLMSESVARMYLSAKTTSQLMIEKAEASRKLIENENKEQLDTLKRTSESMLSVKEQITATADDYSASLLALCSSLENIMNEINKNNEQTEDAISEFTQAVNEKV